MPLRWIWPALLLLPAALGQTPSDVTLTLATKDGQTKFQIGEAIELELKFQASTPGKYAVWDRSTYRTARKAEYDRFRVEATEGAVDPLADSFFQNQILVYVGPPAHPLTIGESAASVHLFLNEWISFRKPGSYRVRVETDRLVTLAQPIASGELEIEITPQDPAWADEQLKKATAVLEKSVAGVENAARVVRFLETPEAVPVIARYLGRGTAGETQIRAAADGTPYRKELIAALAAEMANPELPILPQQLAQLQNFAAIEKLGPMPTMTGSIAEMPLWMHEVDGPYREKAKPSKDEVTVRMIPLLANKKGIALAVSLSTIAGSTTEIPPPAVARALLANLAILPEVTQWQWLTERWPRIASPEAAPVLKTLAASTSGLRDIALRRLLELDPAAARPIVLDRVARADFYRDEHHDWRVLLELPDQTLPQLDDALAANFERGAFNSQLLLARYASPEVAARVKAFVQRKPQCNGPIAAYLFRVDADYATNWLSDFRKSRPCDLTGLQDSEDLLMTPAFEDQLIKDLDPSVTHGPLTDSVAAVLQNSASQAAEKPLMALALRPIGGDSGRSYVTMAAGWLLSGREFGRLMMEGCQTYECRARVALVKVQMQEPLPISASAMPIGASTYRVGPFRLRSLQQVKDKLAQFSPGTNFYVAPGYPGSWWSDEQQRVLGKLVEDAGMKLVDPPARPAR